MGCDIHITRRRFWADKGNDITAEEWLAYVQRDSELCARPENGRCFAEWRSGSWLDWSEGVIFSKNPDDAIVQKMVAIAGQLNATVRDDDGELYDGNGSRRHSKPSLGSRIAGWFSMSRAEQKPQPKVEHESLPFGVGDTVVDAWGFEHTIVSIDPDANNGLGEIRSRRVNDGSERSYAVIAHGFKAMSKE